MKRPCTKPYSSSANYLPHASKGDLQVKYISTRTRSVLFIQMSWNIYTNYAPNTFVKC